MSSNTILFLSKYKQGKLDTAVLKKLAIEYSNAGDELSGKLAAEYLTRIPQSDLGREDVLAFMAQFRQIQEVQRYAASYLSGIPANEYDSSLNLFFIGMFKDSKPVQNLIFAYLKSLNNVELKKKIALLNIFKDIAEAKEIGTRYLNSLPKSRALHR